MKNSQTYLLIYKKQLIESIINKKNFSNKSAYKAKNEVVNSQDDKNIYQLFNWAKKKGGIFENFHIEYLDESNRYVTAKNLIKVNYTDFK